MRNGQEANNLTQYFNANQVSQPSADPESSTLVMKANRTALEINSYRKGLVSNGLATPNAIFNPYIRQNGLASSISGVGLLKLWAKNINNSNWTELTSLNDYNYSGTLFQKLGFNIRQLLPLYGNQNRIFDRAGHNTYTNLTDTAYNSFINQVKPFTTDGYTSASLNPSMNTNNYNFLMGGLGFNNILEKQLPQVSNSLIANNLPQKFSFSHYLIYSNIIPK